MRAEAAIIYNPENGKVLWESNSTSRRSIASITKVMTATVFLENQPDLTREVVVERADVRRLDHVSPRRLQDHDATTCCTCCSSRRTTPPRACSRACRRTDQQGFIDRMNAKAEELGLENTSYADPSGLLADQRVVGL